MLKRRASERLWFQCVWKNSLALASVAVLWAPSATAADYEATVTRIDSNFYRLNSGSIYAITAYCYEYSYSDDVILEWDGYSGQFIWKNSDTKCDVKKLLSEASLPSGLYKITVSHLADNVYEVDGQDTYIMTELCLTLALGSNVYLDWNGVSGKLIFVDESGRCDATQILKSLR